MIVGLVVALFPYIVSWTAIYKGKEHELDVSAILNNSRSRSELEKYVP